MTTNDAIKGGQLVVADSAIKSSSLFRTKTKPLQNSAKEKIRVLIVDDLRLVCEGLQAIFAEDNRIDIAGYALNGREALKQIAEINPDVVILDLLMPVMGGVEATQKITQQYPDVKVLILSSFDDDAVVSEVVAAGAHGYVLKNMIISELALAIHSVHNGSNHFAAGILNSLAKTAAKNVDSNAFDFSPQDICTIDSPPATVKSQATPKNKTLATATKNEPKVVKPTKTATATKDSKTAPVNKAKKPKQPKPEKPLFPYGDWALVATGVIVLSQINGMGHNLAHTGLFLLMLALLARPIKSWWDAPLKYRRGIGVIAFAASLAHAIYATRDFLEGNLATIASMSTQHKWGLWAGIISLVIMAPAAVTSFQFLQRKLGKNWRKIHLLSVPSMILAVLHTILVGPHYIMADAQVDLMDYCRTIGVAIVGLLIYLLRKKIVWSKLKLSELGKATKKSIKA